MLLWIEFITNNSMILFQCNNSRLHYPENSDGAASLLSIYNYILSTHYKKIISSKYTDYLQKTP